MKRRDLEKVLKNAGFELIRVNKHVIFSNGIITLPIPRHNEVNKMLTKSIMKKAGL